MNDKEKAARAASDLEKKRVVAYLKKLVAADNANAKWSPMGANSAWFAVQAEAARVHVRLPDELTGAVYLSRTERFRITVEPRLGNYSADHRAALSFRPRKEGWTDARLREIAAKIVLGLASSGTAQAAKQAGETAQRAAEKRIHDHGLDVFDPNRCRLEACGQNDGTVRVDIYLPKKLTFDQNVQVAQFVHKLLAES